MKLLILSTLLFTSLSHACPELDGVDLADGDSEPVVEVVSTKPIKLSRYKFKKISGFKNMSYTACKNHLEVKTLRMKDGGKVFKAIVSNDHQCDGENTYGGLFDGKKLVGSISDSQITCK